MAFDPDNEAHREWLGYVQPVGLVVSAPALLAAAATVNRNIASTHREFLEWVEEVRLSSAVEPVRVVRDLPGLLHSVFQWQRADFVGAEGATKLPETLEIPLTNYEETLRPTYAVPSVPADGGREEHVRTHPRAYRISRESENDAHPRRRARRSRFAAR